MRRGRGGDGVLATDADGRETVLPLQRTGSGALGVSLPAQPGLAAAARPDAGDSGIPIPPALARAMQPEPAVAGGNGAQATAAPGREPLLPGLSALMGVGLPPIPGLAAAAASETGGGSEIRVPPALARAVQPEPAMAGGETGAEAILPLRRGRGGEGVQATDAQGRVTVLPLQRSLSGALSIRLPQIPGLDALRERPEVGGGRPGASAAAMLARPTFFAKGGAVSRMGGGGGAGTAVASGPPAQGQSRTEPARVTVNVTNTAAGTQTQTTEPQDGSDRIVDVLIEQIEAGIAANTRRGVGPLSDLMAQTYGLGRQPR
jgi:hypothetical protein